MIGIMYFTGLIIFHSACLVLITMVAGSSCPWGGYQKKKHQFGPGCMYMCHCVGDEQCDYGTGDCQHGCDAGWMGPGCQYDTEKASLVRCRPYVTAGDTNCFTCDIAYSKPAFQSSTMYAVNAAAGLVVDGNISTCTQKMVEHEPWWRVDLGATYRISELVLQLSTAALLNNFEIKIGNVSSNSPSDFPALCFKYNPEDSTGLLVHVICTSEHVGRHLMIWSGGQATQISLCDVRVYGGRSLGYGRNATQSNTLETLGEATHAVDGGTITSYPDGTCTHTDSMLPKWWRVDLASVYSITRIVIYNREDCCQERLAGFAMYFATDKNYTLVYQHHNGTPNETTEVTDISMDQARLIKIGFPSPVTEYLTLCEVLIYGDCPKNQCGWSCDSPCFCKGDLDKSNKIIGNCSGDCAEGWNGNSCNFCYINSGDICAVICNNCKTGSWCNASNGLCLEECQPGLWDISCSSRCNYCKENTTCTRFKGHCSECPIGKWGSLCENNCDSCMTGTGCNATDGICTNDCRPGFFSLYCDQRCGNCAGNGSCDRHNGSCTYGCLPGWSQDACNITCPPALFGYKCSQKCGHCANGLPCHHVNGTCMNGCSPGYNGNVCDEVCPLGWFGNNCSQKCGHCSEDTSCHYVNGTCVNGCSPGYIEALCDKECYDGLYGYNCSQKCGFCLNNTACGHIDGTCEVGCATGYAGKNCRNECPFGMFGPICNLPCGHCAENLSCHHINGTCNKGCSPGYNGTMCDAKCQPGTYGYECMNVCGTCMVGTTCMHVDGVCPNGCSRGFTDSMCIHKAEVQQNSDDVSTTSIGGVVGGGIGAVVLTLIVIGLVLWKRRRSSAEPPDNGVIRTMARANDAVSRTYENISRIDQDTNVQMSTSNLEYQSPQHINYIELNIANRGQVTQSKEEIKPKISDDNNRGKDSENETDDTDHTGYSNLKNVEMAIKRILIEDLVDYVNKALYLSTDIEQEFQRLVSGPQYDMNIALKPSNRSKNRYKEIYAYDKTRVVLDPLPDEPESDYINACFINGYHRDKAYIAAQGPTTTIVNDFWRMIWQYNINKIVMLTGLFEQGKQKCHQYWPSEGSMEFGTSFVEIADEEIFTEYTIRFLKVTQNGLRQQKAVTQFHFTAWPDRDVPESPAALVQFWKKVRNTGDPTTNSPTLVHCSAGIGRTGTYIALDYIYDEGQAVASIDVFDCVNGLRRQRVGMVQNVEQYIYLHEVLVEALLKSGKRVDVDDFAKYYQQMMEIDQMKKQSKLQVEFESFQKFEQHLPEKSTSNTTKDPVYEKEYEYACARLPENRMKNRYNNIIPSRRYRPFLSSHIPGRNDYINAVTLQTLKNKNGLLMTQMPLPDTVVDFWTLAFEYKVQTLVMLNEENMAEAKIGIYWPKGDQISQFGPFTVKNVSETRRGTYVERMFHVSREGWDSILNVKQFACSVWKSRSAIPDSCSLFLSFLEEVDSWQRRSENQPMIVHCLNGAERSGLFCVLRCVLERVKVDREVPITSVVRQVRVRRQQIIPNSEQYQFCHDVILEYLTNFATYTNL